MESEEFKAILGLAARYKGVNYGKRSDDQDLTFSPHESSDRRKGL